MRNFIYSFVCAVITHPWIAVDFRTWMSNFVSLFYLDVMIYPCPNMNGGLAHLTSVSKKRTWSPVNVHGNIDGLKKCLKFKSLLSADFLRSVMCWDICTLRWRHNERDGVLNRRRFNCLLNRLFRPKSKKASKLRVTGLCEGNSPVTGEFPAQRASNAEFVSIWWRHHEAECWSSSHPV